MTNLNTLIGARICHDLINPLGAISNGFELLSLAGVPESPELTLVGESVQNATARLKLLRLAFGQASPGQTVSRTDLLSTLETIARGGRLSYSWNVAGDPPRMEVRAAMLAIMCVETALPLGGDIEISMTGTSWSIFAQHERLTLDPDLWGPIGKNLCSEDVTAAQVHFGLLPDVASNAGRTLTLEHGADWVKITL